VTAARRAETARVAGFHPVREALRRAVGGEGRVVRVLVDRRRSGARRAEIESLCRAAGARLEPVDEGALSRFAPGVHNGFGAEVEAPAEAPAGGPDAELVVVAEDVQDPRNLGALLRVCEGAGVGRVLVREHGSAPLSEAAVKASAGAASWIAFERIGSTAQVLSNLKDDGFWIYGLATGGQPPWTIDLTGKVAIVIGGEEEGLRRLTRGRCDGFLGLPMRGRVESLNLATAAAAVLYEAVRQRTARAGAG
jgi:23S rRNA (guanosine2251-2'-O)-methyltransferase